MTEWIDRNTALTRLGIKAQTLYAYASRGRIRMLPDPTDSRRSLYSAEDIEDASVRKGRGRKPASIAASSMDWGEPAIPTSLSTIYRGKLYYRGHDATELAETATLEDVASILWGIGHQPDFADNQTQQQPNAFAALATLANEAQPIIGRSRQHLAKDAAKIIGTLATVSGAAPGSGPIHQRLALGWNCDVHGADAIREALVAMADHDLNASTFAARVAASTGASLPACLLAGLATLSGPRHGGAGKALLELLADAQRIGAANAVSLWLARDRMLPGFGHNLYPNGDPRAKLMLKSCEPSDQLQALALAVFNLTGFHPNCDFGLAAITQALELPEDAPLTMFLVGRSVGWCAHVIEQNKAGSLIRPRGRYQGHLPV